MTKTRLLTITVIGLLLLNLSILASFIFSERKSPPQGAGFDRREPKWIVIERLQLDEAQQQAYQVLIDAHRREHRALNDRCRDLKHGLYALLKHDTVDSTRADSLIAEVAATQQHLEQLNFHHFQQLRKICRPEQLPAFDRLAEELADIFTRPRRR